MGMDGIMESWRFNVPINVIFTNIWTVFIELCTCLHISRQVNIVYKPFFVTVRRTVRIKSVHDKTNSNNQTLSIETKEDLRYLIMGYLSIS